MKKPLAIMVAATAVCLFALSCERTSMLHTYRHTPVNGWEQSDVLTYDIDTIRQAGTYNLDVGVRTTNAFPYKKLWLVVEQHFTNPAISRADTLACSFVNDEEDRNGKGTNTYQYTFGLGKIKLERQQTGKISIRHIMRREMIPGVSDIGINIYH